MTNSKIQAIRPITFIEMLRPRSEDEQGERVAEVKRIVIPIIQRDYAQGRLSPEVKRTRERFLNALKAAVEGEPIELDFVYGDLSADGTLTLLDGQQRLTTLFLLHWYAAKRDGVAPEEYAFLKNFSYETRYSARLFCENLVDFQPSFDGTQELSEQIENQAWFPLSWRCDPTVSGMLVVLDEISKNYAKVAGLWEKLEGGAIKFYFLPLQDMGLTDELYIKMNSRGKPLTPFEHFKAEWEKNLRQWNAAAAERIAQKIDREWTDMLWPYKGDNKIIDDEFLRYFAFACDIIGFRANSPCKDGDEFALLAHFFSLELGAENVKRNVGEVERNVEEVERMFDIWCEVGDIKAFFEKFLVKDKHEEGMVLQSGEINVLEDCLRTYADMITSKVRRFPLRRTLLLYAFVVYLKNKNTITEEEFRRRLRITNNLLQNSSNEIRESNMGDLLKQVDAIIEKGEIPEDKAAGKGFNAAQLAEERDKQDWLARHNANDAERLFALEDHPLLYGKMSVVGVENDALFERFAELFGCDGDLVDCAMLATGDYSQQEGRYYQLGGMESAWQALFHRNNMLDKTKEVLVKLLEKLPKPTDAALKQVADEYREKCEQNGRFDWRYYYIKNESFRPHCFGKYYRENDADDYCLCALATAQRVSEYAQQCFLYAICLQNGQSLYGEFNYNKTTCRGLRLEATNNSFVLRSADGKELLGSLPIPQIDGIDTTDRIELGRRWLAQALKLYAP